MTARVRVTAGGSLLFHCPGCGNTHAVRLRPPGQWTWNGNAELPSVQPSVNVVGRCHATIRNGRISFTPNDTTHALRGKTVDLPPWEDAAQWDSEVDRDAKENP